MQTRLGADGKSGRKRGRRRENWSCPARMRRASQLWANLSPRLSRRQADGGFEGSAPQRGRARPFPMAGGALRNPPSHVRRPPGQHASPQKVAIARPKLLSGGLGRIIRGEPTCRLLGGLGRIWGHTYDQASHPSGAHPQPLSPGASTRIFRTAYSE